MARIHYEHDPPCPADSTLQFRQPQVQLIIEDMVFPFINAFNILSSSIDRDKGLIKSILLISVRIDNLLPMPGKMHIHHIPGSNYGKKPTESIAYGGLCRLSVIRTARSTSLSPLTGFHPELSG